MKNHEKSALLNYIEFLLIKELIEPIIDKHVNDPDVIGASYDAVYKILIALEQDIENNRVDQLVDKIHKK